MHHALLKLLGAKKREEIRDGKLWDITRLWGYDVLTVKKEVAQPVPFVKPEPMAVDKMRVHIILPENNATNLTKDPDLV
jgi:hypothetical protein